MQRDFTNLPESGTCFLVLGENTIANRTNTERQIYTTVGNKWFHTSTVASVPSVNDVCYTYEQITELPSQYDFITPIYHTVAIVSAIFIFWVAYRLLLYPFFRMKV